MPKALPRLIEVICNVKIKPEPLVMLAWRHQLVSQLFGWFTHPSIHQSVIWSVGKSISQLAAWSGNQSLSRKFVEKNNIWYYSTTCFCDTNGNKNLHKKKYYIQDQDTLMEQSVAH